MKKINFITIGLTGAVAVVMAATAFAAPAKTFSTTVVPEFTEVNAQELPELPIPSDEELQDTFKKPEGQAGSKINDRDIPEETAKHTPKLKPENKPEEDLTPPEFEGIENIETLGRPELPSNLDSEMPQDMMMQPGMSEGGPNFNGEMPQDMMPQSGMSEGEPNFNGEMPQDMMPQSGMSEGGPNFNGEMPQDMMPQPGMSEGGPNFNGEMPF